MTPDSVVHLIRQTLIATFWLSAPLLAIGLVAGIIISLLQIVTSLAITIALQSVWPAAPVSLSGGLAELWLLLERMAAEAGFGIAIGLVVALLAESFTLAMQILGVQAGYGYASTIDPNSEAD